MAGRLLWLAPLTLVFASAQVPLFRQDVPKTLPMGGAKSRMTFFVTSVGLGRGGDLGGLAGADSHCQVLAAKEGAGDHTWRAYLSTQAIDGTPAVNARDRIGKGPWYNAEASLIAANVDSLHAAGNQIAMDTALTERADPVGDPGKPGPHDILTGSRSDGSAFAGGADLTCGNWTSSGAGEAQVGHSNRSGPERGLTGAASWNSAHRSRGCSQANLQSTGGAGLFYCFAID